MMTLVDDSADSDGSAVDALGLAMAARIYGLLNLIFGRGWGGIMMPCYLKKKVS